MGSSGPERIGFLLIPRFSMIAFTSAIEPLRLANRETGRQLYEWAILSADGAPVEASNGIAVRTDYSLAQIDGTSGARPSALELDMAIVCSGIAVEGFDDPRVRAWLRTRARRGVSIGALCTGAHVLASAGLLDGHRCSIHWENLPGFVETFPHIEASADLYEVDGKRFTCAGGTAALDMMLHLMAEKYGTELATRVSEQCLVDRMRGPHDRQRLPLRTRLGVHNRKLITAVEIMEANLAEPITQEQLSLYVGLSGRQLERLFRSHLGRTPSQFYRELRLERARHLLYQTELPIVELALACGFSSASHFSKCYREMYGIAPSEERARSENAKARDIGPSFKVP
ncbi:MAG: GlxA family transcriptional regulator [Alphaproteobacteria bacterium]